MRTFYKAAVRNEFSDVGKAGYAVYFINNRKRKNEAKTWNRTQQTERVRILNFHHVLNLKLQLGNDVMISLKHEKIRVHHFECSRVTEFFRYRIPIGFTSHSGRCQRFVYVVLMICVLKMH